MGDIEAKGDWNDENDFNLSSGYYHVTTPGKDSFRKVEKAWRLFLLIMYKWNPSTQRALHLHHHRHL